jgi:hypothetical protein
MPRSASTRRSRRLRSRTTIAGVLAALAVIMALAAGGLYLMDLRSGSPGSGAPGREPSGAPNPLGLPYPEVPRVAVADAKALLDAGTAVFIDVRGPADYEMGHLPGAILMPLPDVETRASELPRGATIITYCA